MKKTAQKSLCITVNISGRYMLNLKQNFHSTLKTTKPNGTVFFSCPNFNNLSICGFVGAVFIPISHVSALRHNTLCFLQDIKILTSDLKRVYAAIDEKTALYELDCFEEKWKPKYKKTAQSWRDNWPNLSTYFKYPQEV